MELKREGNFNLPSFFIFDCLVLISNMCIRYLRIEGRIGHGQNVRYIPNAEPLQQEAISGGDSGVSVGDAI